MVYNPDIHHRRSIRLKGYDYSRPGFYFVTICTKDRLPLFGKILDDGKVGPVCFQNNFGNIARNEWIKTSKLRPNIRLHEFVIMPNHVHGIIEISDRRGTMHRAPTIGNRIHTCEKFGDPTPSSIPTIVRGYKSAVTKQINFLRKQPGAHVWQRNYYEHVIRDEKSYNFLSEYIMNNPINWREDRYYIPESI